MLKSVCSQSPSEIVQDYRRNDKVEKFMTARYRLFILCVVSALLLTIGPRHATAQSMQSAPAYPLICAGLLTTGPAVTGQTQTPFQWAAVGAGTANPAPGQCAWADRGPQAIEILPGGGNVICDFSGAMQSVPAGTFIEVGVVRDPLMNNCMHLIRYIGPVSPPFSATMALPPFVRQSVSALSARQIASLRHGIQVMMSKPATDPTSYRFQADIHGTWDTGPAQTSWNQCQHGSFYFFSWHRMYLYFFDRILRAAAGDPNLVLPYWNWSDPAQRTLPAAFREPADTTNPLFIAPPGRPAPLDAGTAFLAASTVDFSGAMADLSFEGGGMSGYGFGGGTSAPKQSSSAAGDLERHPHNVVHSALGGLMSAVRTAAQDPIFWLHHANIDRLWNQWLQQGQGRSDPGDATWLNTTFTFYDEAGHAVCLTGAQIVDTVGQLNYRYDSDPLPYARIGSSTLMAQRAASQSGDRSPSSERQPTIVTESTALAEGQQITLSAMPATVQLPVTETVRTNLQHLAHEPAPKLILRIDDIHTNKPPEFYYDVFVDPPHGQELDSETPGFVGNLSLFSLAPHEMRGGQPMSTDNVFIDFDISHLLGSILEHRGLAVSVILVPRGLVDASGNPLPLAPQTAATVRAVRLIMQ